MWSVWSCDTVTGDKQNQLPVSAFPWARLLNAGAPSNSASVPLLDETVKKMGGVKALTTPLSRTLVLDWDDTVVYAGIVGKRTYTHATGMLEVQHADLWSLFLRRLAADVVAPFIKKTKQTYVGVSLSTLAKRLVQLSMTGLPDDNRALPITLPADVAGTIKRTYYGYHLNMLADVLEDIINEGPDIDFRPRWLNDKLDWEMRTGTTATPKLNAGLYEWNLTSQESGITDLSVSDDSAKFSTTAYAVGEGTEEDMLMYSNRTLEPAFPAVDHIEMYKTEDDDDRLIARANADLATFDHMTEQWGFSMLASGTPKVSDLLLGGTARVWSKGDPWIPDGWNSNRLIGFSGDLTETVKLGFQPGGA